MPDLDGVSAAVISWTRRAESRCPNPEAWWGGLGRGLAGLILPAGTSTGSLPSRVAPGLSSGWRQRPLRLVDLDVVPRAVDEVEFCGRGQLGEPVGDVGVEVGIVGAEHDPHWPWEGAQLRDALAREIRVRGRSALSRQNAGRAARNRV